MCNSQKEKGTEKGKRTHEVRWQRSVCGGGGSCRCNGSGGDNGGGAGTAEIWCAFAWCKRLEVEWMDANVSV